MLNLYLNTKFGAFFTVFLSQCLYLFFKAATSSKDEWQGKELGTRDGKAVHMLIHHRYMKFRINLDLKNLFFFPQLYIFLCLMNLQSEHSSEAVG